MTRPELLPGYAIDAVCLPNLPLSSAAVVKNLLGNGIVL